MGTPPPLSLVAKALISVAPAVEASILAMALSQSIGEGAWSAWSENGALLYPFEGTNNFGSLHATERFAEAYANGGTFDIIGSGGKDTYGYDSGWGMVAFLDHAPAPYITRMAVYPSLLAGARAFMGLLTSYVNMAAVSGVSDFAAQLYVHNYFEGRHPNRTVVTKRAAAYQAGSWSDDDQANIADYAGLISGNLAAATTAIAAAAAEPGDPTLASHGPPFAPLGLRLTPAGRVYDHTGSLVTGSPHTVDHARDILGDYHPGAGQISLEDALASPEGDGVWMFPEGVGAPTEAPPAPAPATVTTRQAEGIGIAAALVGTAIGVTLVAAGLKFRPSWVPFAGGARA
jgi:hypothetical protein